MGIVNELNQNEIAHITGGTGSLYKQGANLTTWITNNVGKISIACVIGVAVALLVRQRFQATGTGGNACTCSPCGCN